MRIFLFEDITADNFYPLVYFRTISELRSGCSSLGDRIVSFFPKMKWEIVNREQMRSLFEHGTGSFLEDNKDDELVFINTRVQMTEKFASLIQKEQSARVNFISNETIAATKINLKNLTSGKKNKTGKKNNVQQQWSEAEEKDIDVTFFSYPWDIIHFNHNAIEEDFARAKKIKPKKIPGVHFVNDKNISVGKNCNIKPGVVLDAENGAIVIGDNVTIMPNAVIVGPVFIGNNSLIKVGAKIYGGTSIGEWCKVGGEVEASIIQSYSNKQHDGFLGHSFLGSWVNIGADTNTSDLKNNYSNIRVLIGKKEIDTKQKFLGAIIGDHTKTGINVMLNTGSIIGISCNIYGADFPLKFLQNFSWGSGNNFRKYELEKAIETARMVMRRRNIEMTKEYEQRMREVFHEGNI